jgi:hypothetical protein
MGLVKYLLILPLSYRIIHCSRLSRTFKKEC